MDRYCFNRIVGGLLDKHQLTQSGLARRIGVSRKLISNICLERKTLGALLFIKILRRGFGYPAEKTREIFMKAVERKYRVCFKSGG